MMNILHNKKIIVGITGSIAAFKTPILIRELVKLGADVHVVATESALKFVTESTLENLSRNPVIIDMFDSRFQSGGAWHIHLANDVHAMIIVPCSTNTIAKLANGFADNALNALVSAMADNVPIIIAPAMDTNMWTNVATQRNITTLKNDGKIIIPPVSGELSSGHVGLGRLPEIEDILTYLISVLENKNNPINKEQQTLHQEEITPKEKDEWNVEFELDHLKKNIGSKLYGKRVLITAGPTREKIDDVRFLSNYSSGKMGYALAETAKHAGCIVTLISGPTSITPPSGVELIKIESANEMYEEVKKIFWNQDILIFSAAVSDFRPETQYEGKIKREENNFHSMKLIENPDILKYVGSNKKYNQFVVGFALESENEEENGMKKLESKKCDMIILNKSNSNDSGFEIDINTIKILTDEDKTTYPTMSKLECSKAIFDKINEMI